jgi:hypothetical protein
MYQGAVIHIQHEVSRRKENNVNAANTWCLEKKVALSEILIEITNAPCVRCRSVDDDPFNSLCE